MLLVIVPFLLLSTVGGGACETGCGCEDSVFIGGSLYLKELSLLTEERLLRFPSAKLKIFFFTFFNTVSIY